MPKFKRFWPGCRGRPGRNRIAAHPKHRYFEKVRLRSFLIPLLVWGALIPGKAEQVHVVAKGESIFKISRQYKVDADALMKNNGLSDPTKLRVGQRLVIPGEESIPTQSATADKAESPEPEKTPEIYTAKKGETLEEIARRFSVSEATIRDLNGLKDNTIRSGLKLRLLPLEPAPKPPAEAPPEKLRPEKEKPKLKPEPEENETQLSPRYFFISKVKSLLDRPTVQKGRWKYIVLHHSGTPSGNAKMFDYYHRAKGMENGLAYHFVIGNGSDSEDGEIEIGGRWLKQLQGGHVKGDALNEISLGICFVGNYNSSRPTKKQIAAAIELIVYLRQRCGKPYPILDGHKEINPHHTDCPGKLFPLAAFHKLFEKD